MKTKPTESSPYIYAIGSRWARPLVLGGALDAASSTSAIGCKSKRERTRISTPLEEGQHPRRRRRRYPLGHEPPDILRPIQNAICDRGITSRRVAYRSCSMETTTTFDFQSSNFRDDSHVDAQQVPRRLWEKTSPAASFSSTDACGSRAGAWSRAAKAVDRGGIRIYRSGRTVRGRARARGLFLAGIGSAGLWPWRIGTTSNGIRMFDKCWKIPVCPMHRMRISEKFCMYNACMIHIYDHWIISYDHKTLAS